MHTTFVHVYSLCTVINPRCFTCWFVNVQIQLLFGVIKWNITLIQINNRRVYSNLIAKKERTYLLFIKLSYVRVFLSLPCFLFCFCFMTYGQISLESVFIQVRFHANHNSLMVFLYLHLLWLLNTFIFVHSCHSIWQRVHLHYVIFNLDFDLRYF